MWEAAEMQLKIGDRVLENRLFVGTGKYPANSLISEIIVRSGAEVITVALRRAGTKAAEENYS